MYIINVNIEITIVQSKAAAQSHFLSSQQGPLPNHLPSTLHNALPSVQPK
jgi:hypothetical protein